MCDVGVIYDALMLEVFRKAHKGCMHAAKINLSHSHQTALYFSLTVFVCFNLSLFLCMCAPFSAWTWNNYFVFDRIQRLINLNCVRIGKRNSNNLNICVSNIKMWEHKWDWRRRQHFQKFFERERMQMFHLKLIRIRLQTSLGLSFSRYMCVEINRKYYSIKITFSIWIWIEGPCKVT